MFMYFRLDQMEKREIFLRTERTPPVFRTQNVTFCCHINKVVQFSPGIRASKLVRYDIPPLCIVCLMAFLYVPGKNNLVVILKLQNELKLNGLAT